MGSRPRTSDKRSRLIDAAGDLFHRQGFNQTTLADIARAAEVPLGNVYYYYKTKEQIGEAVVRSHHDAFTDLFRELEREPDPKRRLGGYLDMAEGLSEVAVEQGCPVGSLCQELDKQRGPLAKQADDIIAAQLEWVTEQFCHMRRDDAAALGAEFVAALHGIVLVANALSDRDLITEQIERLRRWIDELDVG